MQTLNNNAPRPVRRQLARNVVVPGVFAAAIVALLVPLNMGGCGSSDVGSTVTNGFSNVVPGGGLTSALPGMQRNTPSGKASTADLVITGVRSVGASYMDEARETNLGRNVALQVTTRYGLVDDARIERYVTLVGLTVADASPRNDYPYCFAVLNSDKVNAFSGPNGFVLITRGALAQMQDESELAGVLGHEIGHINKHHGAATASRGGFLGPWLSLLNKNFIGQFGKLSDSVSNTILNTGFSQPEEAEADAEGVRYAAAAGYNPEGYLHFIQRMAAQGGGKSVAFSTHPGLADRARNVADQIAHEGLGGKGQTLRERFAANMVSNVRN